VSWLSRSRRSCAPWVTTCRCVCLNEFWVEAGWESDWLGVSR
jgi:hypothetical protein